MLRIITTVCAALLFCSISTARAAFFAGVRPFGSFVGTGVESSNYAGGTPSIAGWYDLNRTDTQPFTTTGPIFYQETYTTPHTLSDVILDASNDRASVGDILVSTSLGGPVTTPYATFNMAAGQISVIAGAPTTNIYGVRVEATTPESGAYQLADLDFWSQGADPVTDLTAISTSNPANFNAANLTDGTVAGSRGWRANSDTTANPEQYVGVEFPQQTVAAIRVTTAGPDATTFGWGDFEVQVEVSGVWTTVGLASMASDQNIFYGTFDNPFSNVIEGVRLYGSNADGNNPGASESGLIVDEIQVFAPVPEPASLGLLAVGGVMLLRRRRGA